MNRFFLILFLWLLPALSATARETITGTVVDSHGDPMPGVKIEIPGSSEFFFTDLDGAFQIVLKEPVKKLNFTYPGLGTSTYRVKPEMKVMLGKGWSGHEKGFRYLLDIEGGLGFKGNVTIKSGPNMVKNIHSFLKTGLTNTYGYQINKHLYAGIGYGVYLDFTKWHEIEEHGSYYNNEIRYDDYSSTELTGVEIPVFIKLRWDFGLTQKTAPYIGLRIGYSRVINVDDGYLCVASSSSYNYWTHLEVNKENCGSFFIAPSIGYRMTLHNKTGMNIGLRYMTGMKNKYSASIDYDAGKTIFSQRASDVLFLNIGFDF
ncbi:MAG: carboxypeptidase-like regulatory domain-containing protein [Muribaculaceae bacterium]|nr:carboxypeptidase-like regulatory domain-containing protein [Muribaculaceae bacterium]